MRVALRKIKIHLGCGKMKTIRTNTSKFWLIIVISLCLIGLIFQWHQTMKKCRKIEMLHTELGHLPQLIAIENLLMLGKTNTALRVAENEINQSIIMLSTITHNHDLSDEDKGAILDVLSLMKDRVYLQDPASPRYSNNQLVDKVVQKLILKLKGEGQ